MVDENRVWAAKADPKEAGRTGLINVVLLIAPKDPAPTPGAVMPDMIRMTALTGLTVGEFATQLRLLAAELEKR